MDRDFREIKFKAKLATNYKSAMKGDWVHFNLSNVELVRDYVDPMTLCEFTTVINLRQKEVYEHDIVKRGDTCGEVYFSKEHLAWKVDGLYGERQPDKVGVLLPNVEILGNSFDNPELLHWEHWEKRGL